MSELDELNKNAVLNLYHDSSSRIEFTVVNKFCIALNYQPGYN